MPPSHTQSRRWSSLEVSCPKCGVKPGQRCVGWARWSLIWPHIERQKRFHEFADRERWPCQKEGCPGTRLPINAKEMLSSKEGVCSDCDLWITEPAGILTLDDLLRDLAPHLVETHELVDNPERPKSPMEIMERNAILVGEPDSRDAQFHLVPRTKPPKWNPLRAAA